MCCNTFCDWAFDKIRGGSEAAATSKMEHFVIIVNVSEDVRYTLEKISHLSEESQIFHTAIFNKI